MENSKTKVHLGDIYRLLALSFSYPEESWFNSSYLNGLFLLCDKIFEVQEELKSCHQLLPDYLKISLEPLQAEHIRLYVNSSPNAESPPYGSLYIDGEGALHGRSTQLVDRYYQKKGFKIHCPEHPPDYICYEIEFMAILADTDSDDLEEFLANHFRPWFVVFRNRVLESTKHPYYVMIIKMMDFFSR